jgi:uncharacterized protein YjiS (DUF1127 family)
MPTRNFSQPLRQSRFGDRRLTAVETLAAFVGRCLDRHRQRLDLDALDDAALRDIGLSPDDVRRECAKPFWR